MNTEDETPPATQSIATVGKVDWRRIAKAAGEHGVRYRTNKALLDFLATLHTPPPVATATVVDAGEVERLRAALESVRTFSDANLTPTQRNQKMRNIARDALKGAGNG